MPIRTRLTIWYTAVLALILLIFGIGVYIYVTWQMIQQVDSRLSQAANTALPLALSQRPEVEERAGQKVLTLPGLDALRASATYVQLIGPSGQVIGISPNITDPFLTNHLDPAAFREAVHMPANQRANLFTEAQHRGLPPIRVFTQALVARNGEVVGYLQVATSLEGVKAAQNSLLIALLSLGGVGVLFSAVIGVLLARRALRPVDELTKTAMAIYRARTSTSGWLCQRPMTR